MSNKKEHSTMGLPRVSGKRRWSGDDDDDQSPPKAVCTSPPYALCAEDVLPHPPSPNRLPPTSAMTESFGDCHMTQLAPDNEETVVSDCDDALSDRPEEDEEEDENFIDDEEDKDSGFVDGNSIDDNSSDDDSDAKGDTSFASTSSSSSSSSRGPAGSLKNEVKAPSTLSPETDLQISLAKVLPSPPTTSCVATESQTSTATMSFVSTPSTAQSSSSTTTTTTTTSSPPTSSCPSSLPLRSIEQKSDMSVTTVTAAQTGTTVTSAYQGPTPTYDLHSYQASSSYTSEVYQNRPCTPSWSCTFYDGSQPTTTNKYMEISPNRSLPTQSIQCDENGKSYLELGSAAPYASPYTANECGNFTTSPSTYNGSSYAQTFAGAPTPYPPGNTYFNNRPNYPPSTPYGYHGADTYNGAGYEGEGGCSYGYVNGNYVPHNPGRGPHGVPNRIQPQRCSSPICDPTRTSPRPACYQQQRLSVLNVSMFKLNRFSQFKEPSLHRSVLICNTLRHIEREMEAEGVSMAAILAHSHAYGSPHGQNGGGGGAAAAAAAAAASAAASAATAAAPPTGGHCPDTMPSMPSTPPLGEGPLPSLHTHLIGPPIHPPLPPSTPPPSTSLYSNESTSFSPIPYSPPDSHGRDSPMPFEHPRDNLSLRPFSPPLPAPSERQSLMPSSDALPEEDGVENLPASSAQRLCEDRTEGINWCSVLSLSSQTDLDSMNNNECHEWNNEDGVTASHTTLSSLTNRGLACPTAQGTISTQPYSSSSSSSTTTSPSPISSPHSEENGDNSTVTPNWKLPSLSADDVLKSFPESPRRQEEDLDSIIKVLVGS